MDDEVLWKVPERRECSRKGYCGGNNVPVISINESYALEYLNYGNNAVCQWTFNTTQGRPILVHFETFRIEECCDFLQFGTSEDIDAYGRYSGHRLPPDVYITDSFVVVTFASDSSMTDLGFAITLSTVNSARITECWNTNITVIGNNETHALEYLNYGNDALCQWKYSTTQERHIVVHFEIFRLEECCDFLHFATSEKLYGTYSGYNQPPDLIIADSFVVVTFTSDSSITDLGFAILLSDIAGCSVEPCQNGGTCKNIISGYICQCDGGYTGPNCERILITDCGGNNVPVIGINESYALDYLNYGINEVCQWTFNTTQGRHILVHFEIFRIEECCDFLQFGTSEDIDAYGRYSGLRLPPDVYITDSFVVVTFASDSSMTDLGFAITLSTVKSGIFLSVFDL
ncbi:exoskeleton protein RP43-like [Amphiura filiformis]|uniref:exoskeleton protein RP43-like n=1 Tax=Amphiura filiformis TaxID=82378 RepID=UPI003B20BCE9